MVGKFDTDSNWKEDKEIEFLDHSPIANWRCSEDCWENGRVIVGRLLGELLSRNSTYPDSNWEEDKGIEFLDHSPNNLPGDGQEIQ